MRLGVICKLSFRAYKRGFIMKKNFLFSIVLIANCIGLGAMERAAKVAPESEAVVSAEAEAERKTEILVGKLKVLCTEMMDLVLEKDWGTLSEKIKKTKAFSY
jgi:hypothetical protein